jgi:chemotaxis protein CheX
VLLNGVRAAAIARAREAANEMERTMAVSLRESVQLVSDPRNLDASVEEVFQTDAGVNCRRDTGPVGQRAGVGDRGGGLWRPAERGLRLPQRQLGGHEDRRAHDGHGVSRSRRHRQGRIGEICNMLAGAWKGKVPDLAANCGCRFRPSLPAGTTTSTCRPGVQAPPCLPLRRCQL